MNSTAFPIPMVNYLNNQLISKQPLDVDENEKLKHLTQAI